MDLTSWTPRMLSVLRIVTGLLFLEHGTGKLLGFPPSDHAAPTLFSLVGVQGALELVGGFLILIGLFTRPVAFVLAGDMAVAYFMAHAPKSFFPTLNGGQLAILFCSCSFIWRSQAEASGAPMSLWRAHARGDYLDRATIIILRSFCLWRTVRISLLTCKADDANLIADLNQNDGAVQVQIANLIVPRRHSADFG